MKKIFNFAIIFYFIFNISSNSISNENYFDKGLKLFQKKKI